WTQGRPALPAATPLRPPDWRPAVVRARTEPQLPALFKAMAAESAVSQVDPQLGRRRARLRWRQAGVAGASAVATAVVIIASLAISSVVQQRPTGPGPAASAVIAKVPPYFVALTGDALERHQGGLATGAGVRANATRG